MFRIGFILFILGIPFLILGIIGFLMGVLINTEAIEFNDELPLSDVTGIVVDEKNQIYIGLGFYSKIQVYNSSGEFLRNWHVDASGGDFNFELVDENLLIYIARDDKKILYTEFGEVLNTSKNVKYPYYHSNSFTTEQGAKYVVSGWFYRSVEQITPETRTLVSQSTIMHLVKGPFPSWLYAILLMGLGGILFNYDRVKKLFITN